MKRNEAERDYGDVFLAAILIGVVLVVLGVMMAVAHALFRTDNVALRNVKVGLSHTKTTVSPSGQRLTTDTNNRNGIGTNFDLSD